jgi:hypothetical protein
MRPRAEVVSSCANRCDFVSYSILTKYQQTAKVNIIKQIKQLLGGLQELQPDVDVHLGQLRDVGIHRLKTRDAD